jgi:hypothetical protein
MIESRKNRRKRWPAFAPLIALMILGAVSAPSKLAAEEPSQGTNDATPKPATDAYIGTETLEACMARWDEGTHMTRDAWRQSCDRIQRERAPYVKSR